MPKQIPRAWVNYMINHDKSMEALSYFEGGTIKGLHFNADKNQYEGTVYMAYPSYIYDDECYSIVYEEETVAYSIEEGQQALKDYERLMSPLDDYLPF